MLKNPRSECMICGKDISASNYWGGYVTHCKHCYDYDYAEDIDPVTDLNFSFCPNCGARMGDSET